MADNKYLRVKEQTKVPKGGALPKTQAAGSSSIPISTNVVKPMPSRGKNQYLRTTMDGDVNIPHAKDSLQRGKNGYRRTK